MRICVYCASIETIAPHYLALAADVGRQIAARGWELVSGGGQRSMMGAVAGAALAGGLGWVRGLGERGFVTPDALARLVVTTDVGAALDACGAAVPVPPSAA